jgi:hypothetical protein
LLVQGGVYNLVDETGNVDRKRVLKAKHPHALLVKVKREWEIGRCIVNLYEPDKALPGYMATGEGVVDENGNFVGAHGSWLPFALVLSLILLVPYFSFSKVPPVFFACFPLSRAAEASTLSWRSSLSNEIITWASLSDVKWLGKQA